MAGHGEPMDNIPYDVEGADGGDPGLDEDYAYHHIHSHAAMGGGGGAEIQVFSQDVLMTCILLGLIALVGLLGNGLMLRALCRYRSLRTSFFVLLASVAVADSLCLVVAVPGHIIYLTMATGPVNDLWCKTSKYIDAGSGFVAAYHLVVLAVLRGIMLTSRGRNPPTPNQTLACVAVLWVIAFSAAIPFLLTVEDNEGYCHYTYGTDIVREVHLLSAFSCYIPVALILFIYLTTHLVGQRYFEDSYSYKEKQMSKLVSAVVGFFLVLQLPFRALDTHVMYKEFEAEDQDFADEDALESLYIARNYLLCLMMADKAARPIICSRLAPGLSEAFDEVINCTMCRRRHGPYRPGSGGGGGAGGTAMTDSGNNNNSNATGAVQERGKGSREGGRHPSTSSRAPLTAGECEAGGGGGGACSDDDNQGGPVDEMEIVQL